MSSSKNFVCFETLESRRLLSAGSLAPSFGVGGVVVEAAHITPDDMVVQSDGKILISDSTQVMRFNADGSPDASFGTDGVVTPGFTVAGVAIQSDGKIVVGGDATNGWAVARYNSNGTPDTTFGSGTGQVITQTDGLTLGQSAFGVGIESNGDIIVGGNQTQQDPQTPVPPIADDTDFAAICFNPDGSVNTAFGTNGEATSGTLLGFGIGWINQPHAMAVAPNGDISIGGFVYDFGITHYDATIIFSSTGVIESTSYVQGFLTGMVGQSDDSFVYSQNYDFSNTLASIQFPTAQSPFLFDSSVSDDEQMTTNLTAQSNGQIVVLGYDSNGLGLVRYNADGSVDAAFGSNGSILLTPQDLGMTASPTAYDLAVQANGNILIDGTNSNGQLILASVPTGGLAQQPPAAQCDPTSIVRQGRFYEFTVQYSPAELINQATIDDDNIVITSRRGLHERAKVFTFSTAGDFIKVIYRINIRKLNIRDQTAMLNIDMRADQVLDSLGDAVAPGLLAQFQAVFGQ